MMFRRGVRQKRGFEPCNVSLEPFVAICTEYSIGRAFGRNFRVPIFRVFQQNTPLASKYVRCSIGQYGLKADLRCGKHKGLLCGTKPPDADAEKFHSKCRPIYRTCLGSAAYFPEPDIKNDQMGRASNRPLGVSLSGLVAVGFHPIRYLRLNLFIQQELGDPIACLSNGNS